MDGVASPEGGRSEHAGGARGRVAAAPIAAIRDSRGLPRRCLPPTTCGAATRPRAAVRHRKSALHLTDSGADSPASAAWCSRSLGFVVSPRSRRSAFSRQSGRPLPPSPPRTARRTHRRRRCPALDQPADVLTPLRAERAAAASSSAVAPASPSATCRAARPTCGRRGRARRSSPRVRRAPPAARRRTGRAPAMPRRAGARQVARELRRGCQSAFARTGRGAIPALSSRSSAWACSIALSLTATSLACRLGARRAIAPPPPACGDTPRPVAARALCRWSPPRRGASTGSLRRAHHSAAIAPNMPPARNLGDRQRYPHEHAHLGPRRQLTPHRQRHRRGRLPAGPPRLLEFGSACLIGGAPGRRERCRPPASPCSTVAEEHRHVPPVRSQADLADLDSRRVAVDQDVADPE